MKYLRLFESFEDIHKICKKYGIKNYTINPDGLIDVNQTKISSSIRRIGEGGIDYCVDLHRKNLSKIPLKFNIINGNFDCSDNKLTSLEGSPNELNGGFACSNNLLTSFQYSPKIIRGVFLIRNNNIKSFEYYPSFVRDFFNFYGNPIWEVWKLFGDATKIELLNDFDIFRDEDTDEPVIIMDRLNDFLLTIGKPEVEKVNGYKNI